MKRLVGTLVVATMFFFAHGQEDVSVLQYNLLYYGNTATDIGCTESSNNTASKKQYIKTIINYVEPAIFTVNEFGNSQPLLDNFMTTVLNVNGVTKWQTTPIITNNNYTDIVNSIFYDSEKVGLIRHRIAQTATRDIDCYEMFFKTESTLAGDTIKLVCMVGHLKAGSYTDDENKRSIMVQNAMYFCEQNYPNQNILFMGDFNLYSSSEPAYQKMTNPNLYPHTYFVDPLGPNGVGNWSNNSSFASCHTQSTHTSGGCFSSGGLDDRFDFIMMSKAIDNRDKGLEFASYTVIGNDGNHFNKAINSPENNSVPSNVLNALYNNSDHLPIKMGLRVSDKFIGIEENASRQLVSVFPVPAHDRVNVVFDAAEGVLVEVEIYSVQGQLLGLKQLSALGGRHTESLDLTNLAKGFYIIAVKADGETIGTSKLTVY